MIIKPYINCIYAFVVFCLFGLLLGPDEVVAIDYQTPPKLSDYDAFPLPQTRIGTRPKVMILLSNDHTSFYGGYEGDGPYNDQRSYWGYFDPKKTYDYRNGYFYPISEFDSYDPEDPDHHRVGTDCTDCWSGNFLNWLTMAHGDFNRKALTGGRRGEDDANRTRLERSDIPEDDHMWKRTADDLDEGLSLHDFVPNDVADYILADSEKRVFANLNTELVVLEDVDRDWTRNNNQEESYEVLVTVCVEDSNVSRENNCTVYPSGAPKPTGLLQTYMHEFDFGLMTYSHAKPDKGGIVRKLVSDISDEIRDDGRYNEGVNDSMFPYINNYTEKGWDPVAEMYYEALRYFKGMSPTPYYLPSGQNDDSFVFYGDHGSRNWEDPYEDWCDDVSIVIINDEYPSQDDTFPDETNTLGTTVRALTNEVGEMHDIHGNSYLDRHAASGPCSDTMVINNLGDVAGLCPAPGYPVPNDWGETTGTFHIAGLAHYAYSNDIRGDFDEAQRIYTYSVAYRASPSGYLPPEDDMNMLYLAAKYGNLDEVNRRGGGDPTGISFFPAERGNEIWHALDNVFQNILQRVGSGTAAAVVAPEGRGEGEGSVVQAYYKPFRDSPVYPDNHTGVREVEHQIMWSGFLHSLWIDPCGNLREDTTNDGRLDLENDMIVGYYTDDRIGTMVERFTPAYDPEKDCPWVFDPDSPLGDPFKMYDLNAIFEAGKLLWSTSPESRLIYTYDENSSDTDKKIPFNDSQLSTIEPLLGVNNASVDSSYSLDHLGPDGNRAETLINYIRGEDYPGLRVRTLDIIDDDDNNDGKNTWKLGNIVNSTPVVVAGASEPYDVVYADRSYRAFRNEQRSRETMVYAGSNAGMLHAFTHGTYDRDDNQFKPTNSGEKIGEEAWAYIPRSLLPHLKWLADPGYTHVFYVDLSPKVFDAKIRNGGDKWGTFMLLGLNKGGKKIYINKDGDEEIIYPSYTLIDITDPRTPKVMWERSYEGSGLTTSKPAVFKVNNKWFAAFGSGPNDYSGKTDYYGKSDQKSKIYIIDLDTGLPSTSSDDWFVELNDDNAFLNSPTAFDKNINYSVDGIYFGESYLDKQGNTETWKGNIHKINVAVDEDFEYDDSVNTWSHSVLFESPGPVTAQVSMRSDPDDNVILFFGTGRYMDHFDALDEDQQYLFGIKDPLYDDNNTGSKVTFNDTDLFKANPIHVSDQGYVFEGEGYFLFKGDAEGGDDGNGTFPELVAHVRNNYHGWYRELEKPNPTPSERIISRATVFAQALLVPSYTPSFDVCGVEGESNVYALYYQTGTGYQRHILSPDQSPGARTHPDLGEQDITAIRFKKGFSGAPAESISVHEGAGTSLYGLLQLDTGQTEVFEFDPPETTSRITGWRDR